MPRKLLVVLAICALAALAGISCKGGGGGPPTTSTPGTSTGGTPGKTVNVSLWHSMKSPYDAALQRIVDAFNKSQTQYHVSSIYQGSYTDSLNKLISSSGSGNIPSLIQLDDVSTQLMQDSGAITPVQDFVDADNYDLSDFEPKALAYYKHGDKLYSMPFNLAGPILYFDRDDFVAAGLDPDKPPATLDEVRSAAEKLTVRDASGKVTRSGIALQVSPWFFEQMLAKQGALYANNGNGRDKRATQAEFDSPEGKKVIEWYAAMWKDNLAYHAQNDTDALLSVAQDRTSMAIGSTAGLGAAVLALAVAGESADRLGTGPMPAPEGTNGGIILGGASFWILKGRPEAEQRGAWEFIKFASTPEQQAQWHADTGYFPTRTSAYNLPVAVEKEQQFPQYKTAIDQLHASPDNRATQGALIGDFQKVRDRVADAFEQALAGANPDQELEKAAKDATGYIKEYNRTAD